MIGRTLAGRYRIVRELGEGGMGSVFEAEHLTLGRRVAVKILLDQHATSSDFRARFEREAKVLSALSHPNIVTVTDFGFEAEMPFLVMDLLEGRELGDLLEEGLPARRAAGIARQLLRALAHAHASGLVHRDLKPPNVFVRELGDGSDHVTVLDFGLARQVEGGATVTKTGLVLGTPAYMSPEQAAGEAADMRSDVYALGVLLFEMLAGRRPFPQRNPSELMRAHLLTPAPPLSAFARVDPAIEALVARALAKEPKDRFADAREMMDAFDVQRVSDPQPAAEPATTKPAKKMTPAIQDAPGYGRTSTEHASAGMSASRIGVATVSERPNRGAQRRLVFIGGVVLAAVVIIAWVATRPDQAPTPEPIAHAPAPAERAEPVENPSPTEGRTPAEGPSPDRWANPGTLAPMLERLRAGRTLSRAQERRLGTLARRSEDARASLLLAHGYATKRNLSDALERYEEAFERDATIIHEPWVRADLIEIAAAERLNRPATELATRHFDASYADEVEAAATEHRQPWRGRLERMAARLRE